MFTGVYIDDLVSNILFSNNSFSKSNGGVFYFKSNNYNITIINCYMGNNVITGPNYYNGVTEGGAISIVNNNSYISIINSTFESNSALSGGAIYSYSLNSYLTIASCKFIGNTATQSGGAITLEENHENFVIVDYTTYSQMLQLQTDHPYTNKAGVNGTAQIVYKKLVQQSGVSQYILTFDSQTSIDSKYGTLYIYSNINKTAILFQTVDGVITWPGVNSPSLVIYGDEFYVELVGPSQTVILRTNKWGFLINVYPIFSKNILQSSSSSQFIENSATRGGAIYMDSFNTYSIMVAIDFISNKATLNGGGLNLYLANDGIIFQQLRFINNSASNGGGMSLESSNFGTNIKECLFLNNTADLGSGISFGAYNGQSPLIPNSEIVISGTYFIQNHADSGAGVSIDYENNITFSNVSFIGNVATSLGAALNIDHTNVVIISSAIFTNNAVNDGIGGGGGGGIASQVSNDITINNTLFKNNTAPSGGALWLQDKTALTIIGSNKFLYNSADIGGAVFGKSIPLWGSHYGSMTLVENKALIGSAISIALFSSLDTVLANITMIGNSAGIAGTFFWLCTGSNPANLSSCQEPKYRNIVFRNNSAPYGDLFATQPIYIRTSDEYNVTVYDSSLKPSPTLTLYDFYNHKVASDSFTTTSATVVQSNCDSFLGTLESSTITIASQGVVTFNDISANCIPNGNFTVLYNSQPPAKYFNGISDDSEYSFTTTQVWNFRSCYDGEKYLSGACISCENGTYSLVYSANQNCLKCPPEAVDCYSNNLNIKAGYWRISDTSDIILTCLYSGCKGGYGTINYHIQ